MIISALVNAPTQTKEEANLDKMVEWVQNLFKFKHFYD